MTRAATLLGLGLSTAALVWISGQLDLTHAWSTLERAALNFVAGTILVYLT